MIKGVEKPKSKRLERLFSETKLKEVAEREILASLQ